MDRTRPDLLAAIACGITVVMLVVYLTVIRQQDGSPAVWVVALLLVGAAASGYGAVPGVPHRRGALVVAAGVLAVVGLLGILTIGLPVLAAALLCLVAAARQDAQRCHRAPTRA